MEKNISPAAKRRTIEDRCCMCHEKVYLLERHYSSGKLYHRHCCREAERSTLKRNNKLNTDVENAGDCFKENQLSKPVSNKAGSIFGYRTASDLKEIVNKQPSKPASAGLSKSCVPVKYNSEVYEAKQELDNIPTILGSKFSSSYCEPEIENGPLHIKPVQGKPDSVLSSRSPGVVSNTQVKSSTALPVTFSVFGVPTTSSYTHSSVVNKVLTPGMGKAAYNFADVKNINGTNILQSTDKNSDKVASSGLTAAQSCSVSLYSPVIASNAKTSKYVSIVVSSTTASTTPAMTSSALPSCHLGLGNAKTSDKVPSSASRYGNYAGVSLLDPDRLPLFSSEQKMKVKTIGVKDNNTNKPEWQLEAERRQAARNGVYLDPEIHPKIASGQRLENKLMHVDQFQKKECDESKGDSKEQSVLNSGNSQNNAKENLTKLLKKQLNPKKDLSEMHFAVDAGFSNPPVQGGYEKKDNDWVIVKHPSEIDRQAILYDPSPRIAEHDLSAEEMSPPERFRQMVGEGAFSFSNSDRIAELAPTIFQCHPSSYPKHINKKTENPLIPKRKVNFFRIFKT